ncbi:MAG: SOS response-associated peptidase family protein, partial [Pseudolabrys sp.]
MAGYADRQAALLLHSARRLSADVWGLWDEWKDRETGTPLQSCTMVVTNANALAAKVHDRMPVLLQPQDFDDWMAGTTGTDLLKPAPDDYLQVWPVSRRVNSS